MNDKTLPAGIKLAIKTAKDVLILDKKYLQLVLLEKWKVFIMFLFVLQTSKQIKVYLKLRITASQV